MGSKEEAPRVVFLELKERKIQTNSGRPQAVPAHIQAVVCASTLSKCTPNETCNFLDVRNVWWFYMWNLCHTFPLPNLISLYAGEISLQVFAEFIEYKNDKIYFATPSLYHCHIALFVIEWLQLGNSIAFRLEFNINLHSNPYIQICSTVSLRTVKNLSHF